MFKYLRLIVIGSIVVVAATLAIRAFAPDLRALSSSVLARFMQSAKSNPIPMISQPPARNFASKLYRILRELEVDSTAIKEKLSQEDNTRELVVPIPRGRPLEWVLLQLASATEKTPYQVQDCHYNPKRGECRLLFGSNIRGSTAWKLILRPDSRYFRNSGRIAVLIDGFGFAPDKTTIDYLSFPHPLTISLEASEQIAAWTAKIADHYRKEVCIRLPLEPLGRAASRTTTEMIMVHHSDEQIRKTIRRAMTQVPNFTGFCTFMGGRALVDSRVSGIIVSEIKSRHGYIIDMGDVRNSLVAMQCRKQIVPWYTVDETIPQSASRHQIDSLLDIYVQRSYQTGKLLCASPPNRHLVPALTARIAHFEKQGISLVYASQIVEHPPR